MFSAFRFVDKYAELKSQSDLDDVALFEETGKALLAKGIVLRRKGAPEVTVLLSVLKETQTAPET